MIGVVADDTTGANDIGIMFSNNQYSVKVITYQENMELIKDADVLIIDTDSRLDTPALSYDKVFNATKQLKELDCSMYYNKTCSVFRGNIGAEFDAMMDALEENFAVISLAFPKNGRTTLNGIHKVHGKLLENSEFANDPVHPTKKSNLVDILQEQTKRSVSFIRLEVVQQGAEVLRKAINEAKKTSTYCIIDAVTQDDLTIVAEASAEFKVLAGSSAIAEELPKFLNIKKVPNPLNNIKIKDDNGVLIVSGSLTPQTKDQTSFIINQGVKTFVLDSRNIFSDDSYQVEVSHLVENASEVLSSHKDVMIMADSKSEVVAETKAIGENFKMDPLTVSKLVSAALADATKQIADKISLKRLVVAGGDTSGTVCRKLNIQGNYVLREIETGLPSSLAIGPNMLIVLKSGSFGKEDFLLRAVEHLKEF